MPKLPKWTPAQWGEAVCLGFLVLVLLFGLLRDGFMWGGS